MPTKTMEATRNESVPTPSNVIHVKSAIPKRRQELLKWNGWGYKDSKFYVRDATIHFTGNRYPLNNARLTNFTRWVQEIFDVDISHTPSTARPFPKPEELPPSRLSTETLALLERLDIPISLEGADRLFRAHGHTLHEIYTLRTNLVQRIPDVVVWPNCHDDVVKVVKFASDNGLVIIPFGGGTAVSGAIECPQRELRTIVSLDTSQMNRILWVDKENLVACCESGIIGQDLERELRKLGYTSGHEPDSYEFSSLGGWVATRASGMKKNIYGNIEDLLVHVKVVTPKGVLQKNGQVPRMSCGPDFHHLVLGSEGTLGVVTEVVIKIRPLPACRKYGSVVFATFEDGVRCMREIARQRCQPASVRLMDNEQFRFGHSLKPDGGLLDGALDGLKRFYLTKVKGIDLEKVCAMTLLFEGAEDEVKAQEKKIYAIAAENNGFPGGGTNGERGYILTFVIAYIRDLAFEYSIVSESFETSVPWDRALNLCHNVKQCVRIECTKRGITRFLICSRVTQTYDAGCVIYFYFAFRYHEHHTDPVMIYEEIEEKARDEIIACGGSISHHHGVGKLRKKWYPTTVSEVGVALYKAAKRELDPDNVFATDNFIESKL